MTKQHQAELKRLQEDLEAKHEEEMNELKSKHQEETREMQTQMDDLKTEVWARWGFPYHNDHYCHIP